MGLIPRVQDESEWHPTKTLGSSLCEELQQLSRSPKWSIELRVKFVPSKDATP